MNMTTFIGRKNPLSREFIELPQFHKNWNELGLDEESLRMLQIQLLKNPQAGDVVPGTGGLRKYRFRLPNRGKSGGARVLYVDFVAYEKIYLITAYSKSDKENLTKTECQGIRIMIQKLEEVLKRGVKK